MRVVAAWRFEQDIAMMKVRCRYGCTPTPEETPAAAQAVRAGVSELALFRLVLAPELQPEWLQDYWWTALHA